MHNLAVIQLLKATIKETKITYIIQTRRMATLFEGAGLSFDIQKCSKFQKLNIVCYCQALLATI